MQTIYCILILIPLAGTSVFAFGSVAEAAAKILWNGDFETGDFSQWGYGDSFPYFWSISPKSCWPKFAGGDGSCVSIVTSPVRSGKYAVMMTVKNSVDGQEPRDCDWEDNCNRRRSSISPSEIIHPNKTLKYFSERWITVSVYIPADWPKMNGNWLHLVGSKPNVNWSLVSSAFSLMIKGDSWVYRHIWDDKVHPVGSDVEWQHVMPYQADYPNSTQWPDGLKHFASAQSQAALGHINKGGWTDWIIHVKFDGRGLKEGGTGFLEVYKREDPGPWIQILDIKPGVTNRSGMTFDHGIGYKGVSGDYYGLGTGLYGSRDVFWNVPVNRTIAYDNTRIIDGSATFNEVAATFDGGELVVAPPQAPPTPVAPTPPDFASKPPPQTKFSQHPSPHPLTSSQIPKPSYSKPSATTTPSTSPQERKDSTSRNASTPHGRLFQS